jgi:hypothetical protein
LDELIFVESALVMAVVTAVPDPNIWKEICKEIANRRLAFDDNDGDNVSIATVLDDYDSSKHTPVFFGDTMHKRIDVDDAVDVDFDPSISHPACVGYAFVYRPFTARCQSVSQSAPDSKRCDPKKYLEHYIFPTLLPALEELLKQAKSEKCFERKKTRFNAADFLTEYLYTHNPLHADRESQSLSEIPFVQEWWKEHPRPPLPSSLQWSEEEATVIIQSFWQGYKVRADASVQELRAWQREWREQNKA